MDSTTVERVNDFDRIFKMNTGGIFQKTDYIQFTAKIVKNENCFIFEFKIQNFNSSYYQFSTRFKRINESPNLFKYDKNQLEHLFALFILEDKEQFWQKMEIEWNKQFDTIECEDCEDFIRYNYQTILKNGEFVKSLGCIHACINSKPHRVIDFDCIDRCPGWCPRQNKDEE